ncbi:hypothetical protein [Leucobacter insecticola]|nr:hypothetical protein [Leucobacter insecticola]
MTTLTGSAGPMGSGVLDAALPTHPVKSIGIAVGDVELGFR